MDSQGGQGFSPGDGFLVTVLCACTDADGNADPDCDSCGGSGEAVYEGPDDEKLARDVEPLGRAA